MKPALFLLAATAHRLGILPEEPMSEELVDERLAAMNLVREHDPNDDEQTIREAC